MLNTFAFSVENILRSVYAFAALDSFTSRKERPAVLGRVQDPASVASSLAEDADGDLITVDFDIPDSPGRDLIRPAVETILAAMTMAVALGGVDRQLADVYAHIAKSGFDRLEAVLPILGYPEPVHPGI